ncbi:MAG: hypothetical protein LBI19_04105 [Oscillospiraceae bacterium]|jgi:hypothetical protein|nr:hypothetical protein [Oscillospiraceae bacterium]
MKKDVGSITQAMVDMAKAKGYDTAQISGIMNSPEGRSLMSQLNGPGGGAMKDAAAKAAGGDTAALSSLLGSLMSTKEGQTVAKQVMGMKKK